MKDSKSEERGFVGSMVLMSTLATAADVMQAMRQRRQGRDPSEQESAEVALTFVRDAINELQDSLLALSAGLVAADSVDEGYSVAATRRLNMILLLHSLSRLIHGIHQRLLSLYPTVSELAVEEARNLEMLCRQLLMSNPAPHALTSFIDRSREFADSLKEAV